MKPLFLRGRALHLTERDLVAAGGEGAIYVRGDVAYKIYHADRTPPPVEKLRELQTLVHPRILGPREIVADATGRVAGFSMPFRRQADPLCQFAAMSWRIQYGITPEDIVRILAGLQETIAWIHGHRCLVVDLNPYNILVGRGGTEPLHIDVDSWQTPAFPATALMDSVRDPRAGTSFTAASDWFSFAVIACETYLGIHPYRGTHPDYKPAQWRQRMAAGISIFHPRVRLPGSVQSFQVVPPAHRAWLEAVLEHGERSPPPAPGTPGATTVPAAVPIPADGRVVLEPRLILPGRIRRVHWQGGICWSITDGGAYRDGDLVMAASSRRHLDWVPVRGEDPLIGEWCAAAGRLDLFARTGQTWKSIATSGYFSAHGRIFTTDGSWLLEHTVQRLGDRLVLSTQPIASTLPSARLGSGCVVQPMLGTCRLLVPLPTGGVLSTHLPELDRVDLLSASCAWPWVQIVGRDKSELKQWTITLDATGRAPHVDVSSLDDPEPPALVSLDRGIGVRLSSLGLEIFRDPARPRLFEQPGIPGGARLATDGARLYVAYDRTVAAVRTAS